MDVNTHPLSVDIGYLKEQGFMQPETAGVNGSQVGFVLWSTDRIEDISNFI